MGTLVNKAYLCSFIKTQTKRKRERERERERERWTNQSWYFHHQHQNHPSTVPIVQTKIYLN